MIADESDQLNAARNVQAARWFRPYLVPRDYVEAHLGRVVPRWEHVAPDMGRAGPYHGGGCCLIVASSYLFLARLEDTVSHPYPVSNALMVCLSPGPSCGQRIELDRSRMIIGSGEAVDIQIIDPRVGPSHAELFERDGCVYVRDLNSGNGTFVNRRRIVGGEPLRNADIVAFGGVEMRFELPSGLDLPTPTPANVSFANYGAQHAQVINQVGRDQYAWHVQQITQQRESFLREVAATKTKARWLVWLGVIGVLSGVALFASQVFAFLSHLSETGPSSSFVSPINGISMVGWGMGVAGMILVVVGIVLHVTSTARRRRVEQEYRIPPPP